MPKMNGYVKAFKVKNRDQNKNNKVTPFRMDDEKPLEKYIALFTKIKDFKDIELNDLPVYDDTMIR